MEAIRGTALVTGASSGIGRATASMLAEKGFCVVASARRAERKIAYSAGPLIEELPGSRSRMDDEAFDQFISEKTGLKGLKLQNHDQLSMVNDPCPKGH